MVATCQIGTRLDKWGYFVATVWPMAKKAQKAAGKTRKDDVVRMRVTEEQKKALTDAAERQGLELSAWLRQLALRAAGALPAQK